MTSEDLLNEQAVRADEVSRIEAARGSIRSWSTPGDGDHLPQQWTGLALSGGGIRAATFSLGVLQALASRSQLRRFDYLSTVSGGSYIGAWLSAWISRSGLASVEEKLGQRIESQEVTWLRMYSNYMAPKVGLFSADALTLLTTWLRNVVLNLAIFVSLLMAICVATRLLLQLFDLIMLNGAAKSGYVAASLGLFLVPLMIAANLTFGRNPVKAHCSYWLATQPGVLVTVVVPAVVASLLGSLRLFSNQPLVPLSSWMALSLCLLALAGVLVGVLKGRGDKFKSAEVGVFAMAYLVAILTAYLLMLVWSSAVLVRSQHWALNDLNHQLYLTAVATFGPPLILLSFAICGTIVVGLVGRVYWERSREWWGRINAWFFVVGLGWLAVFGLVFYSKPLVDWLLANCGTWAKSVGLAGWLGSLAASLKAPKPSSQKTLLQRLGSKALDVAASVVIIGFLLGVAYGCSALLNKLADTDEHGSQSTDLKLQSIQYGFGADGKMNSTAKGFSVEPSSGFDPYLKASTTNDTRIQHYMVCGEGSGKAALCDSLPYTLPLLPAAAAFLLMVFGLFAWRVDVNKFSLHNMYKNRLIRCYLGASRASEAQARRPQPFTGFDDDDDPGLFELGLDKKNRTNKEARPLHLINAALNITHGNKLAWQERKAGPFTFSPFHCGFKLPTAVGDVGNDKFKEGGYRSTELYGSERDERRFTLGMAMATSGAAVSPNQGRASTKPMAFVMTLFNVRLGRWSPNPVGDTWRQSSPRFGFWYLLSELFGYANEARDYVYLSDGGHFDNTGVYELIRRRCGTIVAVDAGADASRSYEDLSNMVRKCRVDFGAEINLDINQLGTTVEASLDSKGYSVGKIRYADGKSGIFIVIKPTLVQLVKTEGLDVYGYARAQDTFPQQSTLDQFFDESQFESYRALGKCIADEAMSHIIASLRDNGCSMRY